MIINNLNEQAENEILLAGLYNLLGIVNVMTQNVALVASNSQGSIAQESGGNLFAVASQYYKDATLWTTLVQANTNLIKDANGFINPNLVGNINLIIPAAPTQPPGGILSV